MLLTGCGSILGTIINGWLITAFGPRKVVLCTLCVMTCFLFIVFFAPSKQVLLVGEILLGFEWGIVSLSVDKDDVRITDLGPSLPLLLLHTPLKFSLFSSVCISPHTPTCVLSLGNLSREVSCEDSSPEQTNGVTGFLLLSVSLNSFLISSSCHSKIRLLM